MLDAMSVGGFEAVLWLLGIAVVGFLVSWVLTDVLRVRRGPYVAALGLVTGGVVAGFLVWSGAGAGFWIEDWPWGVLGAIVAGIVLAMLVRRRAATAGRLHTAGALWEGVVYGATEGLLLSVLPVVATWQAFAAADWTEGWRGVAAGAAAIAASMAVIVVHHLGYRGYRGRALIAPLLGCTILSVASLISASPIAAMGGHVILHLAMLRRGMEMPPHAAVGPGPIEAGRAPAPERERVASVV